MPISISYTVTLESSDKPVEVTADDRDWAAMELQQFPDSARMTISRYLAWHALHRLRRYTQTWEKFNNTDCVSVEVEDDDDAEVGDPKSVPGPPEASGGS